MSGEGGGTEAGTYRRYTKLNVNGRGLRELCRIQCTLSCMLSCMRVVGTSVEKSRNLG